MLRIEEIGAENESAAVAMISSHFAKRPLQFWQHSMETLKSYNRSLNVNYPLGFVLVKDEVLAGVMLTPAAIRKSSTGDELLRVNFASWFVKDEYRKLAASMLLHAVKYGGDEFIDVTASARVEELSKLLGFEPINNGTSIIFLPWEFLKFRQGYKARPVSYEDLISESRYEEVCVQMKSHATVKFLSCLVRNSSTEILAVFKKRKIKSLPVAELIYCEAYMNFDAYLPAISSFLVKNGVFLLRADIPVEGVRKGLNRNNWGRKIYLCTNKGFTEDFTTVNYFGTEVSLFDF